MQSDYVIYLMLGVLILAAFAVILGRPLKTLILLIIRSVIGAFAIFATDFLLSPIGLAVGINGFTALITGLLGIPGFVMLYAVTWILGQ